MVYKILKLYCSSRRLSLNKAVVRLARPGVSRNKSGRFWSLCAAPRAGSSWLGVKCLGRPSDEFPLFHSLSKPRRGVLVELLSQLRCCGEAKGEAAQLGGVAALAASWFCNGITHCMGGRSSTARRVGAAPASFMKPHENDSKLNYIYSIYFIPPPPPS